MHFLESWKLTAQWHWAVACACLEGQRMWAKKLKKKTQCNRNRASLLKKKNKKLCCWQDVLPGSSRTRGQLVSSPFCHTPWGQHFLCGSQAWWRGSLARSFLHEEEESRLMKPGVGRLPLSLHRSPHAPHTVRGGELWDRRWLPPLKGQLALVCPPE